MGETLHTFAAGHWTSYRDRRGRARFAFARRLAGGGYAVRVRDAELSPKPLETFEAATYDELRAALRRRGAEL